MTVSVWDLLMSILYVFFWGFLYFLSGLVIPLLNLISHFFATILNISQNELCTVYVA